jgi:TAG lipase/lysophosphatidylethanolamine acyltransferase
MTLILGANLACRRQNPTSKHYDYRLIYERLQAIIEAREEDDIVGLLSLLRSGLVRNLGNITAPRLFNRAYAGTKLLIEDYVTQVALAIEYVTSYPTTGSLQGGLTNQAKLDVLHDTRQAFGRSVLVLQGGSIFGLCHLGVVRALHLTGLLPRIIAGTATGALIAALVGVHTEDELLEFMSGEGIDLSAFAKRSKKKGSEVMSNGYSSEDEGWFSTTRRRVKRFVKEGHLLDMGVLEQCVRANVEDFTFEEAYARTKRVLNITVSTTNGGVPNLLNYLTAPNVVSLIASSMEPWLTSYSSSGLQRLHRMPRLRSTPLLYYNAKTSREQSFHGHQHRKRRLDRGHIQSTTNGTRR